MICSTLQLFTPYIPRTPTSSGVPFRQTRNKKNATSIEILLHRDPLNSRSLLRKLHRSIHQKKKTKKFQEGTRHGKRISSMAFTKKVTLRSSDGELFIIDRAVALQSRTIQYVLEDTNPVDAFIPVPAVDARTLSKVLEYCKKHLIDLNTDFDYSEWDKDFVDVEVRMLYDLIMAADYLNIPPLIDLICDKIASLFKGQTPEKIREIFNIENDFSKEEDEDFKKKSGWAFK